MRRSLAKSLDSALIFRMRVTVASKTRQWSTAGLIRPAPRIRSIPRRRRHKMRSPRAGREWGVRASRHLWCASGLFAAAVGLGNCLTGESQSRAHIGLQRLRRFHPVRTAGRPQGFIAIEVKYAESMQEPAPALKPRYDEIADQSGLFIDARIRGTTRANPLQQLWREHLLAQAMLMRGDYDEGRFVVIAPRLNYHVQNAIQPLQMPAERDRRQARRLRFAHARTDGGGDRPRRRAGLRPRALFSLPRLARRRSSCWTLLFRSPTCRGRPRK